ncbi:MAG: tryptophan--tRNA ligase [Clostridiales bacterium]|nr:tryptophan--tRNA ligase [Clostridiales bacterium]
MEAEKKAIFSGMQPTGMPHLGNYLGALKNWVALQDEYRCVYCIVDMHSLTVRQDPAVLRRRSRELLQMYIAMGLDPEKAIIYFQSHVSGHAELAWILNCFTYMGELGRMTQFKEKSQKNSDNINAGLFTYPVLMAADILLYNADLVPIGDDQRQHMELCRNIALRFNNIYGDVFTVPEPYLPKIGARIMGLAEPERKMSKSDGANENNLIYLLDKPELIMKKFKSAVTDSGNEVKYSSDKPGISNLLVIYSAATGVDISQAENEFEGKGYGFFKQAVGEAVIEFIKPIQRRFEELNKDKDYVDAIIRANGEKANAIASRVLRKVKKKVGFPAV